MDRHYGAFSILSIAARLPLPVQALLVDGNQHSWGGYDCNCRVLQAARARGNNSRHAGYYHYVVLQLPMS